MTKKTGLRRGEKMEQEKNLDFDTVIDRKNTDCLKYDFAVRRGKPQDVLPLWVADMDFKTSSLVLNAIQKRVEHGVFGYTESGDSYFEAVASWMREKHNWQVERRWLVKTPGVVFALAMAVKAYTDKGDAVLIQQPVYYPFTEVIEDNGRIAVSSDLVLEKDGKYRIDFEDFERKITENHIRLFLLCSPHNPVGRVWTKEELVTVGQICQRHQVIVVSDEIHEDFVFCERSHQVFAALGEAFADISITCTSPAKTFNLAGLQVSNIFIANAALRGKFRKQIAASGYSQLNAIGLTACEAAYRYGTVWYDAMMRYVGENIRFMREYLEKELPQIHMIEPEGTYLVWLDFRDLKQKNAELEELVVNRAKLWLDSGAIFGKAGEGFERINVACPRSILKQALEQLKNAIICWSKKNM
jgi:cystathionine beta-lyase